MNAHGDSPVIIVDYIGESAIGGNGFNTPDLAACGGYCPQGWSWHVSFCGDIDLVGLRKPQSYYRNVLWNVSQLELMVHAPVPAGQHEVVASWGWPDERPAWTWDTKLGAELSVNVYTRYHSVGLFVNGKEVTGSPATGFDKLTATFTVPYATGALTAIGYNANGHAVENVTLRTAGPAVALRLSPDRAVIRPDRGDLSHVTVSVIDDAGVLVPTAAADVSFSVTGAGELAAVGTGDPADPSSFYQAHKLTYHGQAMAILRPDSAAAADTAPGSITLTATAPGLTPATTTVTVQG